MHLSRCIAVLVLLAAPLGAQQAAAPSQSTLSAEQLKQLATREFGASFELLNFPALFFDVDGDGAEDAILVATSKEPMVDAIDRNYKVVDPYDSYFGFGDPKITAGFAPTQIGPPRHLLVVHDWRAATPKSKFVIINLPFDKLSAGRTLRKKRTIPALSVEESGGMISFVYWDGKKYKWEPNYMAQ